MIQIPKTVGSSALLAAFKRYASPTAMLLEVCIIVTTIHCAQP